MLAIIERCQARFDCLSRNLRALTDILPKRMILLPATRSYGDIYAEAVDSSTGSAHYLLIALLEKGLIKLGNFTAAQHGRRYANILNPKRIAEKAPITQRFLERKVIKYEALTKEIDEHMSASTGISQKTANISTQ